MGSGGSFLESFGFIGTDQEFSEAPMPRLGLTKATKTKAKRIPK
jgi:hypothetical protein